MDARDNDLIRRGDALAAIDQVVGAGGGFRDVLLKALIYSMIKTQVQPAELAELIPMDVVRNIGKEAAWAMHNGSLWLEMKFGALAPCFPDCLLQDELRVYSPYLLNDRDMKETWWPLESYGTMWRLWTDRPTKRQMEVTEWTE